MPVPRFRNNIHNRLIWYTLLILTITQIIAHLSEQTKFTHQLLNLKKNTLQACTDFYPSEIWFLTDQHRSTISGFFISLGCFDLADQILPIHDTDINRKDLYTLQSGLIAWELDGPEKAIYFWSKEPGINIYLLRQARELKDNNVEKSISYYEASIKSARNLADIAENLTYFIEDLRSKIDPIVLADHLQELSIAFGDNTIINYRLAGQANQLKGDYKTAIELLTLAVEGGFDDSETWFYIGEAAWKIGELNLAEHAFDKMINDSYQITWRKAWYHHRFGYFLMINNRLQEAYPHLTKAVELSSYYGYLDTLSIYYSKIGNDNKASQLCEEALFLANQNQDLLKCK